MSDAREKMAKVVCQTIRKRDPEDDYYSISQKIADALLAAYPQIARAMDPGMVVVPREATREMAMAVGLIKKMCRHRKFTSLGCAGFVPNGVAVVACSVRKDSLTTHPASIPISASSASQSNPLGARPVVASHCRDSVTSQATA